MAHSHLHVFSARHGAALIAVWLASCSTPAIGPSKCLDSQSPPPFPFVARYDGGGKRLSYVAAFHTIDPASRTYRLVEEEFRSLGPQIVIVEGLQRKRGHSPAYWADDIRSLPEKNILVRGEPFYSASLALKSGIPFVGAEPEGSDVVRSLLSERFSTEDIVGFLIARQIPQWEREKKDVEASFDLLLSTFNKTVLKVEFGLGEDGWLTRKQFLAWYRKRTGVEFCVSRRDGSGCSTYSSNHAEDSFMTRLARAMGRVRERSIQQTIAESLEVKRRVLVVYGGNHYLEERAFLAEQLGKPCMER